MLVDRSTSTKERNLPWAFHHHACSFLRRFLSLSWCSQV